MRNQRLIFYTCIVIALSLFCVSCSAIKSYPDRTSNPQDQLSKLSWCFTDDLRNVPSGQNPTVRRNDVINCRIYAIDLQFTLFEQSIAQESISLNTGVDLAVVGLGAATTVVNGAAVKSILGAISGGITGGKGIIDKDIFYSKTMPALLSQMEAQRKTQLLIIRTRLRSSADEYSLSEALIDVENYYKAGSIPAALQGIVEQSGAVANDATQKLKKLRPASAMDVKQITDVRNSFNTLFNSWNNAPTSDEGKKALANAKKILLKLDSNAVGDDGSIVFEKLNNQISDADPGSDQFKKLIDAFKL